MNLETLTLADARALLQQRALSSLELTEFYLERIARYDSELHAFILVTAESAREEARRADAALARGENNSPLLGIPLALKDIFETQGVPTTAGSEILRTYIPAQDAFVIARLRAAGAVLLGKLNLHEFAYGVTNDNPHFGRAQNPWARERITGGSSGGSGVAVAARLCLGALGTDTGGSIRIPAALCGVTGIKPTYGRVSLRGVIPLSWSMDHAGPLAQTAQDCALILQAIAGYDAHDPASAQVAVSNFCATLNEPLHGLRFATPQGYFAEGVASEVLEAVEQAARVLEDLGAVRIARELPFAQEMFRLNRVILPAEAVAYHRENLAKRSAELGADLVRRLQNGLTLTRDEYVLARRRQAEITRQLELYFADLDFLVIPTTRVAAPLATEDAVQMAHNLTAFTAPFNLTGFPALSLPCGFTHGGLPIGLQIVGRKWQEGTILQVAHQYQRVTDWHTRRPPL